MYIFLVVEGISLGRRQTRLFIRLRRNPELWFWVLRRGSLKDMTEGPTAPPASPSSSSSSTSTSRRSQSFVGFLWLPGAIEGFSIRKEAMQMGQEKVCDFDGKLREKLKMSHSQSQTQDWSTKFSDLEAAFSFFFWVFFNFQGAKRWPHQICRHSSSSCWEAEIWSASTSTKQLQLKIWSYGSTNFQGWEWKLKFIISE